MSQPAGLLVALEGGGTRSQAALMDGSGRLLALSESSAVNTNFIPFEQAQGAVVEAVKKVLASASAQGDQVRCFVSCLVGPRFGLETFGELCPNAVYRYYRELSVVFARAGIYHPHGVGVVAATGATVWGVRADDSRQVFLGGWGSLLGDEGSAYALGLAGLRTAVRAFERRTPRPTALAEAVASHYGLNLDSFRIELVRLAYHKPLGRTEIAGLAPLVTRLAGEGDPMAICLTSKVAGDLSELALSAARQLFTAGDRFDVVMAGGLVNAGELILEPFRQKLHEEFPQAVFQTGSEAPAVALGRLALHNLQEEPC